MKIKFLALCAFFILIQCTVDQDEITDFDTQNLSATIAPDVVAMQPNPKLDNNDKGLYQGTVATHDMAFHEKITINFGNDDTYTASILAQDGTSYTFIGKPLDRSSGAMLFTGALGQFSARPNNELATQADTTKSIEVFDAIINQTHASITAFKDRSTRGVATSLGSFASNDGSITGTWDFSFVSEGTSGFADSYSIPTLTIVRDGGSTFVLNSNNSNYQRLCSSPGSTVPLGVVNSSFFAIQNFAPSIELAGATLSYTFAANRLEAENAGCLDAPSTNLNIAAATWSWNGIAGTITINTSSLPDFSGF